jgi:ABC-type bacteriocin/lantibiotic exporter with double-glycine peptidase domain
MTPFKRFIKLLDLDRKDLIYLYIYAVFQGVIYLSIPLGIQAIMGFVLAGRLSSSWIILTTLVTLGVVVAGIFQLLQLYIVEVIQRRIFTRASFDFAARIPNFHLQSLSSYYPPELINRFFDTVSIQKGLPKILIDFSSSILQILVGLILLSIYHPVFIAFSFILVVVIFIIIKILFDKGLRTSIQESTHKYQMAHWLIELARHIKTFKINTTDIHFQKVNEINNQYLTARMDHFSILMKQYISIISLKALIISGLLIIGAILLLENSISIGQFVAAEIIIILIINSAEKLIISLETVYEILTSVDKIGKVVELPLDKEGSNTVVLNASTPLKLTIENLQIHLRDGKNLLKKELNTTIYPKDHIQIKGGPGSGKSSLLKIISTITDNYTGQIKYNDIPIKNLKLDSIRQNISVIFDQSEIFYGSIIENITLGADFPFELVQEICNQIGLTTLIESLPNTYFENISNSESLLSATDRAKICIARALIKNPKLLIIEDLFSNLPEIEGNILMRHIIEKSQEITTIWLVNNPALEVENLKTINL